MAFVAASLVDTRGRRTLLISSSSAMALSTTLLAFALAFRWDAIATPAILLVVCAFGVGLGPLTFIIPPEILDIHIAATAISYSTALYWLSNFIVAATFLPLYSAFGGFVFLIYTAALIAYTLFV